MGRHTIVEKLDVELKQFPIRRESQVVYLLAEIRKVIDHEKSPGSEPYEVLELFCNWALHTTISRKSNADRIRIFLKAFDMKTGMDIAQYLRSAFFNEIIQLETFHRELRSFLQDHHLPLDLVDNLKGWFGFIYLYTSVVSEVPLQYAKGDLLPDEVREVVITRVPNPPNPVKLVRWHIKLLNGQEFSASTLYGAHRNERKEIVALPDFFLEGDFQL
jgi:hypothetical protein